MRGRSIATAVAGAALALPVLAHAAPYPPVDQKRPPLVLKTHGIFWAGGRIVNRTQSGSENAGDLKSIPFPEQQVLAGQAYVEYFIPQKLRRGRSTLPIVFVPGGGLVGVHFLTTPDGREGWADYFLRRGYPVYVADVPGRGRAGFVSDAYNNVRSGAAAPGTQPELRMWDSSAWLEWNTGPLPAPAPKHGPHDPNCIGNDARDPNNPPVYCNGDLMPALDEEGYKHWLAALMPDGPVAGGVEPGIIAALEKVGPAIVIAHSAAGTMGGRVANERPELFRALIGIEPAGDCNLPHNVEIKGLARVPSLSIHGINQVGRPDTGPCLETYARIRKAGGDATYHSLPSLPHNALFDRIPQSGIWGNDHIMMWDTNSDEIAGILLKWIEQHVEWRR
jgi:pimeloyl-ACP methyl ester carboxylesterase